MAKYRPIDLRIWNDRKFAELSCEAKLLWIFLLTAPTTLPIPGVVVGGGMVLAEQLGCEPTLFDQLFEELFRKGLSVRREGRLIWLPNALKYQPPRNPNMVKGWATTWDDIPECDLKLEIWQALKIACKSWSKLFDQLFTPPFGKQPGKQKCQEQEQEQEQDQKQEQDQEDCCSDSSNPASDPDPERASDWRPSAGSRALGIAAARVNRGEITQGDVAACWDACRKAGVHERRDADEVAAKWIEKQRPARQGGSRNARVRAQGTDPGIRPELERFAPAPTVSASEREEAARIAAEFAKSLEYKPPQPAGRFSDEECDDDV